jgi:lipoprotein-anchoring transpeptidase ErfK/SrfK
MHRAPRRRCAFAAFLAASALFLAACSGGERPTLSAKRELGVTATTAAAAAAPLPPGSSYAAHAVVPSVKVYDAPNAAQPTREFENPWHVNDDPRYPYETVFLVEEQRGDWLKVLLPVRPNGSSGWIRSSDVRLVVNPFRIEVDLSDRRLEVFQGNQLFMEDTVAIGAPGTPTPIGRFYIRVLLQPPTPDTVYGAYAYGLSSHSETLNEFNGGDAEVGIHGNNDTSALGKDVSNGCIRMDNDKITRLTKVLQMGTPVEVRP